MSILNDDEGILHILENSLDTQEANVKDAIEKIIKNYKKKSKRLEKIIKQSDRQQFNLKKVYEELNDYKNNLEIKVQNEVKSRQEKEKMLMQQSKMAAMGEMIDAVAHQWKQPLNILSLKILMLELDYEMGSVNDGYIKDLTIQVKSQIQHMVDTLDEFRTFLRPNKKLKEFNVTKSIKSVLLLTKDEFIKNKISTKIGGEEFNLLGVENEFKHIILNIINNSKDAFVEKNIPNREIIFKTYSTDSHLILEIDDNAGGIPKEIIDDIFKPNVTTKSEGKGTGIGLYMSLQIIKKHHGEIKVENIKNGVKFTIKFLNQLSNKI